MVAKSLLASHCAVLVLVLGGARGQEPPAFAPAAAEAAVAFCAQERIPGLSCAIGWSGAVVFARGFGRADVENDVPAGPATVYRLASLSKPITATLAMQFAEPDRAGALRLDLDADVAALVPGWRKQPWPVTTRQLLAHLGGVRHYRPAEAESTFRFANQTEAIDRFAADPLLHEPGTAFHYSTYGYNLVAAALEQVGGKPFAALVRERVALPAGAATLQDDDLRRLIPGRAQGYVFVGNELQNSVLMDASYKVGGGGLCASAPDVVRFAHALLAGKLVRPETLQAMWTPQRLRDGSPVEYGLGFRVGEFQGRKVVFHTGAQPRVSTMLFVMPDAGLVVVVLCNLEKVRLQPLVHRLAELVLAGAGKG